jgi:hypothetical protein
MFYYLFGVMGSVLACYARGRKLDHHTAQNIYFDEHVCLYWV